MKERLAGPLYLLIKAPCSSPVPVEIDFRWFVLGGLSSLGQGAC